MSEYKITIDLAEYKDCSDLLTTYKLANLYSFEKSLFYPDLQKLVDYHDISIDTLNLKNLFSITDFNNSLKNWLNSTAEQNLKDLTKTESKVDLYLNELDSFRVKNNALKEKIFRKKFLRFKLLDKNSSSLKNYLDTEAIPLDAYTVFTTKDNIVLNTLYDFLKAPADTFTNIKDTNELVKKCESLLGDSYVQFLQSAELSVEGTSEFWGAINASSVFASNTTKVLDNFLGSGNVLSNLTNSAIGNTNTFLANTDNLINQLSNISEGFNTNSTITYGFVPLKQLRYIGTFVKTDANGKRIPNVDWLSTLKKVWFSKDTDQYRYKLQPQGVSTLNELHDVVTELDASTGRYVAYFSKQDDEGNDKPVQLQTPGSYDKDDDNRRPYHYFFYSQGFSFTLAKKTQASLQYGAFKTQTPLMQPDGKNEFSFDVALDICLSIYKWVRTESLGISNDDIHANDTQGPGYNLNIVMLQGNDEYDKDKMLVNKFVLEDIAFTKLKDLNFTQTRSQQKTSLSGIYKRVLWVHNLNINDVLKEI